MKRSWIIGALLILTSSTCARSEVSADEALRRYDERDPWILAFGRGIEQGFNWSNAWRKDQKLYCLLDKLVLTDDQIFDIVRRYVRRVPVNGTQPFGGILLFALTDTFPCKPSN
jgi:hypothetical protein